MADDGRRDVRSSRSVAAEFEHDDHDDLRLLPSAGGRNPGEPCVIELDTVDVTAGLRRAGLSRHEHALNGRCGGGATCRHVVDHGLPQSLELMRNHLKHCASTAIAAGSDKADAMYDELLELMYKHAR